MSEQYKPGDVRNIDFSKREDLYSAVGKEKFRGSAVQNGALAKALKDPSFRSKFDSIITSSQLNRLDLIKNRPDQQPSIVAVRKSLRSRIGGFFNQLLSHETNVTEEGKIEDRLSRGMQRPGEKAKKLGDFVANREAPKTGKNSCGAAVGTLLNSFGFKNILPQSNRNGNNWDTILDKLPKYFKKVPCSHPSMAAPGGILVYNGGAGTAGSDANRKYGHVEIKSTRGEYVSYVKATQPGGSARNAKNAQNMGFCGAVYYPV